MWTQSTLEIARCRGAQRSLGKLLWIPPDTNGKEVLSRRTNTAMIASPTVNTALAMEPELTPPKRRLGRPPTLDRDAALLAARKVIAERGLHRTRYSDVAEASGVPVTTLQHAFGSLQGMLLESMRFSVAMEVELLRQLEPSGLTPWQRLAALAESSLDPPDDPDSWPVWVEFWALAGRDAEIGEQAGLVYQHWWGFAEEIIRAGIENGDFTTSQAPADAAVAVAGMIEGVGVSLMMRADGPDRQRAMRVTLDGMAQLLGAREQPGA